MTEPTSSQTRKETLARIKEMVAEGKTLKEAIAANGISSANYYNWRASGQRAKTAHKRSFKTPIAKPNVLYNGDFFEFVLTNPKFTNDQRVKVLLAYTQA